MSNKLTSLRRDLEHIGKHRTEILQRKSRLATRLSDLNKELRLKKISYESYESKFKYLLGGKSVEEKKKHFKKRLAAIKHREKDLLSRIKHETHAIKNRTKLIAVTAAMLIIFAPLIGSNLVGLTGMATTADSNVDSRVEVQSWIAASLSYSSVIFSGSAGQLINATLNYDSTASTTAYSINYSSDSNVEDLKICIQGENMVSGANTIPINKLNTSTSLFNSNIYPARSASMSVGTSDAQIIDSVDPGDEIRQRYWLDIPSTQVAASDYVGAINITLKSSAC